MKIYSVPLKSKKNSASIITVLIVTYFSKMLTRVRKVGLSVVTTACPKAPLLQEVTGLVNLSYFSLNHINSSVFNYR